MRKKKNSLQIFYYDENEELVRRFKGYTVMEGKTISEKVLELILEYVRRKEKQINLEV